MTVLLEYINLLAVYSNNNGECFIRVYIDLIGTMQLLSTLFYPAAIKIWINLPEDLINHTALRLQGFKE